MSTRYNPIDIIGRHVHDEGSVFRHGIPRAWHWCCGAFDIPDEAIPLLWDRIPRKLKWAMKRSSNIRTRRDIGRRTFYAFMHPLLTPQLLIDALESLVNEGKIERMCISPCMEKILRDVGPDGKWR